MKLTDEELRNLRDDDNLFASWGEQVAMAAELLELRPLAAQRLEALRDLLDGEGDMTAERVNRARAAMKEQP